METEQFVVQPVDKKEAWGFRFLVIAIFLTPLIFVTTTYVSLDLAKACLIVICTAISGILYALVARKENKAFLPPRLVTWSSIVVILSLIVSALTTHPAGKSFFGQGFELNTAGFLTVLFAALVLVYNAVSRRPERLLGIYAASIGAFFLLELFHLLRFVFGAGFMSLGSLSSLTSTVLGGWYALASYALLAAIILVLALSFLPLTSRMKIIYSIGAMLSGVAAFFVNDIRVWAVAILIFLGLAVYKTYIDRRIAWLLGAIFILCALFAWKGASIAGPAINKIGAGHSELSLPWQLTLDVGAAAVQDDPLLGAGPNRFSQAYIANKPAVVNGTNAWNVEFSSGFALIPTLFVTQGLIGIIAWILFFIFFGIMGVRIFRKMPALAHSRFMALSSYASASFLWIILFVSNQPHAIVFLAFVMTGASLALGVSSGALAGWTMAFEGRTRRIGRYGTIIAMILAAFWGVVYAKNTIALAYFGSGVKALTASGDPALADADFAKALALASSDVYWQARAEAGIVAVQRIAASVSSASPASTTQAAAANIGSIIDQSVGYARQAISYDPANYYNHLSLARVSALAAGLNMPAGYDAAVRAYGDAIRTNPANPSLYLSLAQFQASQNKLPEALQTVGAAIQVKNNYLEAVYLLSQIAAAQGNVKDAIIAAKVGTEINPQSPVLFFQLGILQYTNGDYVAAAQALEKAIALQSDYANAKYFLGLSYARQNRIDDALIQFNSLEESNPDNKEISAVLQSLRQGRSPFTSASTAPKKAGSLPVKEKSQ